MFYLYDLSPKTLKRWRALSGQCRRRLTEQQISPDAPGTILKDINTLLEFVGPGGLATKSRNVSLPAKSLPELNAKIGHPIQLHLQRPLLRDYPNLAGLFALLRVMELLQMKGNRLVVGPAALRVWQGLNFTEQYFALLEALLFQAQSSILAVQRHPREDPEVFALATRLLGALNEDWCPLSYRESVHLLGRQGELPTWRLLVLQQLGLIETQPRTYVERERRSWGGNGWLVAAMRLTPWGTAVTWVLLETLKKWEAEAEAEYEKQDPATLPAGAPSAMPPFRFDFFLGEESQDAKSAHCGDAAATEDEPAGAGQTDEFGMLQGEFQPYFPEWLSVYERPAREARTGAYIFKVTLAGWRRNPGIWRRFSAPPGSTLEELAGAILSAFQFDEDHLYGFSYRDHRGQVRVYHHSAGDEGPFLSDVTVQETDLAVKDSMLFTFDYGDDWKFEVRLEKIEDCPCRQQRVKMIASAGNAPEQYPSDED